MRGSLNMKSATYLMMEDAIEEVEGLTERIIHQLKEFGIETVYDLAVCVPDELVDVAGGSRNGASYIITQARNHLSKLGIIKKEFITAKEIFEEWKNLRYCTTGSRSLDSLLGGGIETKAVTEVIGAYGSGKSQLCHTLSVTCQLPYEEGGLNGKVIYIDTEGTFRANRIKEIALSRELDPEKILAGIFYVRVYNVSHLELVTRSLGTHTRRKDIKLIIVDSIISPFRSEYIGRENLSERQQKLNIIINKLRNLAEFYGLAVVITNQVLTSPSIVIGDSLIPAGGNVIAHGSTYRIFLRRSGNYRIASIIDSPCHPFSEARFTITEKGISDS